MGLSLTHFTLHLTYWQLGNIVTYFFEDGYYPETSAKIGGDKSSLGTSTWSEVVQLKFMRHFLGEGFEKHMQENEFLDDVFGFTPKKKNDRNSSNAKRASKHGTPTVSILCSATGGSIFGYASRVCYFYKTEDEKPDLERPHRVPLGTLGVTLR
ncbi:hypothetical protein ACFE04_002806 [Oxalis oulophora]